MFLSNLNHFWPFKPFLRTFHFIPPENTRQTAVSGVFSGDKMRMSARNGLMGKLYLGCHQIYMGIDEPTSGPCSQNFCFSNAIISILFFILIRHF